MYKSARPCLLYSPRPPMMTIPAEHQQGRYSYIHSSLDRINCIISVAGYSDTAAKRSPRVSPFLTPSPYAARLTTTLCRRDETGTA